MKPLIIQGSSRSNGDTGKIVDEVKICIDADVVDLKKYNISQYDYEHAYTSDDFMKVAEEMTGRNKLIFVSPVYWYSMSGLMKAFFDRLTDLLDFKKEMARQLAGKDMYVISCSNSLDPGQGFELPFAQTAEYLDMNFKGYLHTWVTGDMIPEEVKLKINQFVKN
ncbi:NADPH-dependent FMN reductase [Fulvivirga imtechensis AK7]|uniref:NADPH-dependent FMN reductase n=1 Tax=Fulvivirga imtechensis AK7 TaxID=1237149 RepID=L8JUS7_9BACT|nr:NAD(P)H-dependent oxidoreductase [Fulvivirga imtechensis]ELR72550.1 NADPH-dependent FMN reductase [Fulvivirga imtechensis AK7]